ANPMTVRVRLERLERQVGRIVPNQPSERDFFAAIQAHAAYLRGEGPRPPDPPCPLGFDPAAWRSRMTIWRCLDARKVGELREGEYLDDMTDEEKALVDGYLQVFAGLEERLAANGEDRAFFQPGEYLQVSVNQGLFLIGHVVQVFPFAQLSNRARIQTAPNGHP